MGIRSFKVQEFLFTSSFKSWLTGLGLTNFLTVFLRWTKRKFKLA